MSLELHIGLNHIPEGLRLRIKDELQEDISKLRGLVLLDGVELRLVEPLVVDEKIIGYKVTDSKDYAGSAYGYMTSTTTLVPVSQLQPTN